MTVSAPLLFGLMFLTDATPAAPDRPPERSEVREARPLTLAQVQDLLLNSRQEWTVEQLQQVAGVRPVPAAGRGTGHHWHLADGTLLTVCAQGADGRLVITCWGPVTRLARREKNK
jgi:hypothetical protein